jgi:outer membrane protein assembly complex protein YaeT
MMQIVRRAGLWAQKALISLLFVWAGIVFGAIEDYEGMPVASVAVEPLPQPFPASELSGMVSLKKGQPLRAADIRATIEKLFATGRYSDIVVDAKLVDGQAEITFITRGNWFVAQVTVTGAGSPPSRGQLINATGLKLGAPFQAEDLATATSNLHKILANNGFFEARVESSVERDERTQQANIHFEVTPGRRARIARPVVQGDFTVPESRIVDATSWRGWFGWQQMTYDRMQQGLRRVTESFQEKDFLMARVTLEEVRYDPATQTATPYLRVNQGPAVRVDTVGAKVNRGRLKKLVPVFEERAVDQDLLSEGARELTESYQAKGYFDAYVSFKSETAADGSLLVHYLIDRGERQKLVSLTLQGNHYFDTATIRERMLIAPASVFQQRHGRFSAGILERDMAAIAALYRSNGFRDVKTGARIDSRFEGKPNRVAVSVNIEEGHQWFVSSFQIEGVSEQNSSAVRSLLQSGPGQPFSDASIAADRESVLSYYYNQGYPNADFEFRYKESEQPSRMELQYRITEGPRYTVREVLVGGLQVTHPRLVNKRIGISVGDPVSQIQMTETQRRLYDLGIFAKVETAVQNPDGEETSRYTVVQVEESHKYSLALGLGAELARIGGSQTDLTTPAGEAGFSPRASLDISRLNFRGLAHTVTLRTRVSSLQQRMLLSYAAPQIRGLQNVDLSFTALFDNSEDVRTFSARRWEGSTQIAQRWTRSKTFFYRFAYRRVSVDESTLKITKELVPLLSQPVRVGVLSAGYVDDRRDDPTDSHSGTYNSLDLGVASRVFASEADFFRLLGRNSTYHRLGRRVVLARTMSFGLMTTLRTRPELPPSPQDIPLPERFFSGGASSLRAFPENQAGPRDLDTGFPLGGKALLTFSTELRFPLFGQNLRGVLFHDAGNVYSSLEDISFRVSQREKTDFDYMVHSAGFGVRYRTPVGPVRMDFSFSPNSPRFFGCNGTMSELISSGCQSKTDQRINRFQFHFSLGQTF